MVENKTRGTGVRLKKKKEAHASRRLARKEKHEAKKTERREARIERRASRSSDKKQSIKKQFKEKKKAQTFSDKSWYKNAARNKGMKLKDYYAKHVK